MPLGPDVRYRVRTMPGSGEKVRLAFQGNEVVEAVKLPPTPLKHKVKQRRKRKYSP